MQITRVVLWSRLQPDSPDLVCCQGAVPCLPSYFLSREAPWVHSPVTCLLGEAPDKVSEAHNKTPPDRKFGLRSGPHGILRNEEQTSIAGSAFFLDPRAILGSEQLF